MKRLAAEACPQPAVKRNRCSFLLRDGGAAADPRSFEISGTHLLSAAAQQNDRFSAPRDAPGSRPGNISRQTGRAVAPGSFTRRTLTAERTGAAVRSKPNKWIRNALGRAETPPPGDAIVDMQRAEEGLQNHQQARCPEDSHPSNYLQQNSAHTFFSL